MNLLDPDEQATLSELTRRARAAALTQDDVKRIWPRKVAVVALAASAAFRYQPLLVQSGTYLSPKGIRRYTAHTLGVSSAVAAFATWFARRARLTIPACRPTRRVGCEP